MGFSTSLLKDSAVIQHRLQLEDRGRMEDVPVFQFCGLKITLLIKYSKTNVIASTQKQLDGERRVLDVHPFDEDNEPDPIAPMDCPRCGKETPREKDFCVWCGQATSHDAVEEIKAEEQDLRDSILTLIKEDPELLDDIEKAQEAMTVFENRPDLLEDAERFREAMGDS